MTRTAAKSLDELNHVEWLRRVSARGRRIALGIGDDMAALRLHGGLLLIASDMLLDGVHFNSAVDAPRLIGRKALACNLSDCAAMAVRPLAATCSVALPSGFPVHSARELHRGMQALARRFDVDLVGGDTTVWRSPLAIDVAIVARPYNGIRPVLRTGARSGDRLYVTGKLGGSILGRHLRFMPRVEEARRLALALGARLHAMMDVSDGLLLDLHRLCRASKVGATLDEQALERLVSPAARRRAQQTGRTPIDHATSDGEDFELLLAARGPMRRDSVPGVRLSEIGAITTGGLVLRTREGSLKRLEPKGYVHA